MNTLRFLGSIQDTLALLDVMLVTVRLVGLSGTKPMEKSTNIILKHVINSGENRYDKWQIRVLARLTSRRLLEGLHIWMATLK